MAATFSFLFIDDEYLKTNTPLGKSIDVDLIFPFIQEAQDIYTQDLLGTPLYDNLQFRLFIGTTYSVPFFSAEEINVIELCSKALAYWTVYLALPHLAIQIRNLGVARATADNTALSSISELKYIRDEMSNLGEFYNQRVVNYICEHKTFFPLYGAASKDMYPQTFVYDSDIYIEDRFKDISLEELKFLKKYLS